MAPGASAGMSRTSSRSCAAKGPKSPTSEDTVNVYVYRPRKIPSRYPGVANCPIQVMSQWIGGSPSMTNVTAVCPESILLRSGSSAPPT
jgi:hypothetical protein